MDSTSGQHTMLALFSASSEAYRRGLRVLASCALCGRAMDADDAGQAMHPHCQNRVLAISYGRAAVELHRGPVGAA